MAFRAVGFGTAADHHVHHKLFVFNYGHLFMYWDRLDRPHSSSLSLNPSVSVHVRLFGTYRDPTNVQLFNKDV